MNKYVEWYRKQSKYVRSLILAGLICCGFALFGVAMSNRITGIIMVFSMFFVFLTTMIYTTIDDD